MKCTYYSLPNGGHYTFGSNPKDYDCCICGKRFHDYGNNPQPISQSYLDRCCNECNKIVLAIRSERHRQGLSMYCD